MNILSKHLLSILLLAGMSTTAIADALSSAHTDSARNVSGQTHSRQTTTIPQSAEWGLTDTEWQRYNHLLQGRRGIQSPGADPITILGLEARTPQERRHYAEMLVHQEKKRAEAELALQQEYDAAWKRLWPDLMRVGAANSRLAIFVRTDCGSTCSDIVARVITQQRNADFWLVDSGGDDAVVRRWAVTQKIPASLVQSGAITLNHDNGHWLKQGQGRIPAVLQQNQEGQWIVATF